MTTKEAIVRWINYIERRKAERTVVEYRRCIWRFAETMPAGLQDVRQENIENFLYSLRTLNSSTVNWHLCVIKSFFHWASDAYDVPNPVAKIKRLLTLPPRQRILSEAEYSQVLTICNPDERCIVEFLSHTGLRASESLSLSESNANGRMLKVLGKANKVRFVPLNSTAVAHFATFIYLLKSKKRLFLYKLCQKLSKRAGIPRFGPHALRHYFASLMIKRNASLYKLSRAMGHANTRITESTYIHLIMQQDLQGFTDVLDEPEQVAHE